MKHAKPERLGLAALLERAAAHIHVNAECLRRSSTCRGKWFDREDLDLYNEEIDLEKRLRRAARLKYRRIKETHP